jgi:hypothetical protein
MKEQQTSQRTTNHSEKNKPCGERQIIPELQIIQRANKNSKTIAFHKTT